MNLFARREEVRLTVRDTGSLLLRVAPAVVRARDERGGVQFIALHVLDIPEDLVLTQRELAERMALAARLDELASRLAAAIAPKGKK